MGRFIDLTGNTYGKLTVIRQEQIGNRSHWLCKCECGNTKIVRGSCLRNGDTQSCGCLQKETIRAIRTTHGMSYDRIYNIYKKMVSRCNNPKETKYPIYGGRGIRVCKEWEDSFEKFYEWAVHNGYSETLTIDRIDVNGNYQPDNCRWANLKTQANNKRNNHNLTYKGETHTLSEWGEITGIGSRNIERRINKFHWNVEDTIEKPLRKKLHNATGD